MVDIESRDRDVDDFFNGTFRESFNALVTATTGPDVVTLTLTNAVSGNLTMQFSTGDFELDLSANGTIVLTEGTFNTPKTNWIFIPISTKVLTVSETGYPLNEEYIPVTFTFLADAAEILLDGAWVNQNWNDHLENTTERGHMSHMGEVLRLGTGYNSGIDPNGLDQDSNLSYFNDGAAITFKATGGVTYQMHRHVVNAFDTSGSDDIHVVNWNGDNYHSVSDLKDIIADSTGASLSNKYFNVFFFEVGNKTGEYSPFMAMLPSGSYVSQTSAENDVDGHDNLSMPREFILDSTVGVPICRMTMRWSGGLSTLTHISTTDLRFGGLVAAGGATGTTTTFADNQFNIFDEADITKVAMFDVGTNVPTSTTNTYQFPSAAGIIALTSQTDGTIDHTTDLSNIGTNTHVQIDTHLALVNEHIDWTNATQNLLTSGNIQGADIKATSELQILSGADERLSISEANPVSTLEKYTFLNQRTGSITDWNFMTQDSDTTDDNYINIIGRGIDGIPPTTLERLRIGFNANDNTYRIGVFATGSGGPVLRDLWIGNSVDPDKIVISDNIEIHDLMKFVDNMGPFFGNDLDSSILFDSGSGHTLWTPNNGNILIGDLLTNVQYVEFTVTGEMSLVGGNGHIQDNKKWNFGTGDDISVYFDSEDLIINSENVTANDEVHFTNFDKYTFDNAVEISGDLTVADAKNIIFNTTIGTQIGTSTSQKLSFYGVTPIVQPTALTAQDTSITHIAPGTPDFAIQDLVDSGVGSTFGFATKDEGNTVLQVILNLQTRLAEAETKLQSLGILA